MEMTHARELATKILALVQDVKKNLRWGINFNDSRDALEGLRENKVDLSLVSEGYVKCFPVRECVSVESLFPKKLYKTAVTVNLLANEDDLFGAKADAIDKLLKQFLAPLKVNGSIEEWAAALQSLTSSNFTYRGFQLELKQKKSRGGKVESVSLIETTYRRKKEPIDVLEFILNFDYSLYLEIQGVVENEAAAA